jgi:tRNA G18 (ribose-2'-O)-methylase SpoU
MVVILHNIRSTYNVGSILRSCACFGIEETIFSGYTPRYNDPVLLPHLRNKLNHQIEKTALGAEKLVKITFSNNIFETLQELKKTHLLLGLENNISDPRLIDIKNFQNPKNRPLALLLGEETKGIPPELYPYIDQFLEIPLRGQKESLNVSVATAIALYELTK